MIIALDAMGGDYAPLSVLQGAVLVAPLLGELQLALIGNEEILHQLMKENAISLPSNCFVVHSSEVIEMAENPTRAMHKQDSSIVVGYKMLLAGKAQAFCSAGNTGAMMVGAVVFLKAMPGIQRPAIVGFVPKPNGKTGVILDVGANADCKPEFLNQFAEMGTLYAQYVLGIEKPLVGLMNIGEEESKGTLLTKESYGLLKANEKINFFGNIEGRDVFRDDIDVIVCDGFTGNIILKNSEAIYDIMISRGIAPDDFFAQLNYELHGGSPIIGVNGNVVIGHGVSSPEAIKNMVLQCKRMIDSSITEKLSNSFSSTVVE